MISIKAEPEEDSLMMEKHKNEEFSTIVSATNACASDNQSQHSDDSCKTPNAGSSNTADGTNSRLSPYNKNAILQRLIENGCSAWGTAKAIGSFKVDPERTIKYFNTQAELAQTHVREECGSLSFENISAWLNVLESVGLHNVCDYEASMILKVIADNEKQPDPAELGGVDLRSIYKFLGNALMGLPQADLDQESAKFLAAEFEMLINDVNTNAAGKQTKNMKDSLLSENLNVQDIRKLRAKLSLDPLGIDNEAMDFF